MLFAPVRLGSTALSAEVLTADVKNCKHFGPCGVGEKALYLNGFLFDRHYYVALGDIHRVFKRVAMSKGGFTGNGVFGAIPYLVVEYGDGTQKQCTFKREDHVDDLLAYLAKVCPGLPLHSVQAEQRLARKAQEEAVRYLDVLTPEAQAAREKLEKARTFLAGYPKLTDRLSTAAKAKRANEHTNPAHKWVALAIVLAGLIAAIYGIIAWRRQEGFGMYFTLLGLAGAIAKPFKNRLVGVAVGTAAVCGIRFLCSFLSGVLIWGNLSDGLPAWTYSLTYNGSYMLPETILTTVAAVLIYKAAPQLFAAQEK